MLLKRLKEFFRFLKSLMLTNGHLIKGMWTLAKVPQPAITVFGGSRISKNSIHAKRAFEIGKRLTEEGFSIITGGGPGIMEEANRGAYEVAKEYGIRNNGKFRFTSLGISLTSFSRESHFNPYVHDKILMKHFFARKWLLVRNAVGFIVFPGGFGTLDELFEIITLEQNYKMSLLPIVLMDKRYWEPIIHWIKSRAFKHGLIDKKDLDLISVTSSVEEAICIITEHCKGRFELKRPLYTR